MKLILFSQNNRAARSIDFSAPAVLGGALLGLVLLVSGFGYLVAWSLGPIQPLAKMNALKIDLATQQAELGELRSRAREQIDALAVRMGELNARAIRLNALGRRLTAMAKLDDGEFDFDSKPALGGPLEPLEGSTTGQAATFFDAIDAMDRTLHNQQQQLTVLEGLLMNRKLKERVSPKGRPVKAGYISSYFGSRTDPFTGKGANHRGVDFAGKTGSDVIAVAAGVVTYSGPRSGYGNMVEITHGNGYVTRYAHNEKNLVAPGDQIQPGQVIALMGATGRATGPNLHFEVWHHGRPVNPVKYIRQET
ncbi:MAG: M23 family metallopeptidase [Gammaproteobacteria bacterium]|nr:MAG: M23 family metallopeptidase [Gammaproteobacteria bacterium]